MTIGQPDPAIKYTDEVVKTGYTEPTIENVTIKSGTYLINEPISMDKPRLPFMTITITKLVRRPWYNHIRALCGL